MSVTNTEDVTRQPTHIKGLYRWQVRNTDVGDGTSGVVTLICRLNKAADPPESLWFWLTEVWFRMTAVTAQPAQLEIPDSSWPEIDTGFDTVQHIGVPAPAMQADTFGASAPVAAILPSPYYLGQPAPGVDSTLTLRSTNTDTAIYELIIRGFATQYPINPLPALLT